jgi:hypothetical protein
MCFDLQETDFDDEISIDSLLQSKMISES